MVTLKIWSDERVTDFDLNANFDTIVNVTTGHSHNGVDSRKILYSKIHGSDNTENTDQSGNEVILTQIPISANTLLESGKVTIFASIRAKTNNLRHFGTFRLRVGTSGTTADSQVGHNIKLADFTAAGILDGYVGGMLMFTLSEGSGYNFDDATTFFSITGQLNVADTTANVTCDSVSVIGY